MKTQQELAEEESAAWEELSMEEKKSHDNIRSFWAAKDPERSQYQVENRRSLFLLKNKILWVEVDEHGLATNVAVRIAMKARRENRLIEDVLEEYKAAGNKTVGPDGRVFYKKPLVRRDSRPPPEPRDGWARIRRLCELEARRMLSGEDPAQVEPLIDRFMIAVKNEQAAIQSALRKQGEYTLTRQQVVDACRTLSVPAPKVGALVNPIYKKHAKRLRFEHHQDRLKENYDEEYYLRIGRALDTIDQYNERIGEGT